jgi:hypothetical protein
MDLTLEQRFCLCQLRLEAGRMSREELVEALLEEREDLLLQRNYYVGRLEMAGVRVEPSSASCIALPDTEEELVEIFGYKPSDAELSVYLEARISEQQEAARMDVDIEAIALGLDEE